MFEKVKHYYDTGLWTIDRVFNVVDKAITTEEYQEITGFVYPQKSEQ